MKAIIDNVGNWITEQWELFEAFIRNNHSNPLLWVGILIGGLLISMWTFDALNKDSR